MKIRGRSSECAACGETTRFTKEQFRDFDYEKFTQSPMVAVMNLDREPVVMC